MISKHNTLSLLIVLLVLAVFATIFCFDRIGDRRPLLIGFIMTGEKTDAGWNGRHYQAIAQVASEVEATLLIKENVPENTGECIKAIEELAAAGARLIILSSFAYPAEAIRIVGNYPEIWFSSIAAEHTAPNMGANFIRVYQGRYLSGIIAGLATKTNKIGYVAAIKNSEVNRGINAFTFGVKRVNPQASVVVAWTDSWQDNAKERVNASRLVQEAGCDVLTYHQNQSAVADTAEQLGVDFIAYHEALSGYSEHFLTAVVCDWVAYYQDIVQRYLKGEHDHQVHWLGIDKNSVFLSEYSPRVTARMRDEVDKARAELIDDLDVFSGTIYDNQGIVRCKSGETLSDRILLEKINWLAEGVTEFE